MLVGLHLAGFRTHHLVLYSDPFYLILVFMYITNSLSRDEQFFMKKVILTISGQLNLKIPRLIYFIYRVFLFPSFVLDLSY